MNAPGTVDAGYRGEIKVMLLNTDVAEAVKLVRGDRVAQLVIQKVERARFLTAETLPGSYRGEGASAPAAVSQGAERLAPSCPDFRTGTAPDGSRL